MKSLLSLLCFFFIISTANATNLLVNAGFEDATSGWALTNHITRENWAQQTGNYGLALRGWEYTGRASQVLPIGGRSNYTFSVWGLRETNFIDSFYVSISIYFYESLNLTNLISSQTHEIIDAPPIWSLYSVSANSPTNAEAIKVEIFFAGLTSSWGECTFKMDDASLLATPTPFSIDVGLQYNIRPSVLIESSDDAYFVVMESTSLVSSVWNPVGIVIGMEGYQTWVSDTPVTQTGKSRFFCLNRFSLATPQDWDGDGIDDVTEFENTVMDALDPADALMDNDGDGLNNGDEILLGTDLTDIDTDKDGVDDYYESLVGTDPNDLPQTNGLNLNWVYFNSSTNNYQLERLPSPWFPLRFFNVDYRRGMNSLFILAPKNLHYATNEWELIQLRCSYWDELSSSWSNSWYTGCWVDNITITDESPFHGLPTMGSNVVDVFRLDWPHPEVEPGTCIWFAPFVETFNSNAQTDARFLLKELGVMEGEAGYGSNNWLIAPQFYGLDVNDRDYCWVYDPLLLENGGFEQLLSSSSSTNWLTWGTAWERDNTQSYVGTNSFVLKGNYTEAGIYQDCGVIPGEEIVISAQLLTLSGTHQLEGNQDAQLKFECYDSSANQISVSVAHYEAADAQPGTWISLCVTNLVPPNTQWGRVVLVMDGTGDGWVYYDDVKVERQDDYDLDGIPDYRELEYGLDPFNPWDAVRAAWTTTNSNLSLYHEGQLTSTRFFNGSFEDIISSDITNVPHWGANGNGVKTNATIMHDLVKDGTNSLMLYSASQQLDTWVEQWFFVRPGEEITLSGYMMTPTGENQLSNNLTGLISLEYVNENWEGLPQIHLELTSSDPSGSWIYYCLTSIVPQKVQMAGITFKLGGIGSGNVYFDDIQIAIRSDLDMNGTNDWWESHFDADYDGMPDAWELAYGFNPANSDGSLDADGDNLSNYEEYCLGTRPDLADSDYDNMPDWWEVANNLDATNGNDASIDIDRDELSNYAEFIAGTDIHYTDSDNDRLSDGLEVLDLLSSPLTNEVDQAVITNTYTGAQFTNLLGDWVWTNTCIQSETCRGCVQVRFEAPTSTFYQAQLYFTDNGLFDTNIQHRFRIYLDSSYIGYALPNGLIVESNIQYNAGIVLPWVTTGSHTLAWYWDNTFGDARIEIQEMALYQIPGEDSDGNGMLDWEERRLNRLSGLLSTNTQSCVSPAVIEGKDPYPAFMTIDVGSRVEFPEDKWYAKVPLSESGVNDVNISYQMGAKQEMLSIDWTPLNLLDSTNEINLQKNDSLLLTMLSTNSLPGDFVLSMNGSTNQYAEGTEVPYIFSEIGDTRIDGTYIPNVGPLIDKSLLLHIQSIDITNSPVLWSREPRYIEYETAITSLIVECDNRVSWDEQFRTSSNVQYKVVSHDYPEDYYVGLRNIEGVPVTNIHLRATDISYADETYTKIIEVDEDGVQLVEMGITLTPFRDDITILCEIFVAGVVFDNGALTMTLDSTDFNDLGQSHIRFYRPSGVTFSVCHTTHVYQNGKLVGAR